MSKIRAYFHRMFHRQPHPLTDEERAELFTGSFI